VSASDAGVTTATTTSAPPPAKAAARTIGRRPRMGRFLRALIFITIAVHLPVAAGIARAAEHLGIGWPWLVGALWGTGGIAMFLGRARAAMPDRKRNAALVWCVDIPYFVHWCACVFVIVPAIVGTLVTPILQLARGAPLGLPLDFYMATYALGLVVCGYGVLVRRRWFRVDEVEIALTGLDPRFDGYRIAHLSDLHIGSTTPRSWGERWSRAANARTPDLTVVTGDMVTSGTDFYDDIAGVIGALRAKDGVFVSMGNHDYFGEGELITKLTAAGARVLRNEGVVLERDGGRLYLAAIDDTWTKRDDMTRALAERPADTLAILLAHDPDRFPSAAKRNVALTLSGHTHGGQIAVPFLNRSLSLSHLAHHFHVGLYAIGNAKLYVHPGLGTTGPPMRLGVAPAVVMITLRAAIAAA
jgi:predicted MPP superfamily phosphohydrolase